MTTLARNVAANIAGAVFIGVVTLAAAPLVLRWLGPEAYGLVAFQATAQSLLLLLDAGFSVAINREIASLTATPSEAVLARSVMRTVWPFYWIAAVLFGAAMVTLAPLVADRWLPHSSVPRSVVIDALRLMSLALVAQFVSLPCTAAFLGLQRQVLHTALSSINVLSRIGGGVIVAWVTRDVTSYFVWQVIASVLQVAILGSALHRVLPPGGSEFRPILLRRAWDLARGVALISVMAALALQADKLAVSRAATLTVFGYYSIASLLAMTTGGGAGPIANAVFPRFSQLVTIGDREELRLSYHRAVQTMAVMVIPIACVLSVWAPEVLFVWTGDRAMAAGQSGVAVLLICGMAMNGMVTIPYMLQLANGWPQPALFSNGIALLTFVPAMFFAAARWGPFATAIVFAAMHASYLLIGLVATERRLLAGAASLFPRDIAPALLASLLVAVVTRLLLPAGAGRIGAAAGLALAGMIAFASTIAFTPAVREWMAQQWRVRSRA